MNNKKPLWNVVEEHEFKSKVLEVFEMVSGALGKTLGPYGSTTIMEELGEMHITKDGWSVLKKIRFDESIHNTVLQNNTNSSFNSTNANSIDDLDAFMNGDEPF